MGAILFFISESDRLSEPADECEVLTVGQVLVPGIETITVTEHTGITELVVDFEGHYIALLSHNLEGD